MPRTAVADGRAAAPRQPLRPDLDRTVLAGVRRQREPPWLPVGADDREDEPVELLEAKSSRRP
jgi:hypothetical protein